MSQSLIKVYLHYVFSTKDRLDIIPKELLTQLHLYIGGIINNKGCDSIIVGGTENHIHILCTISATTTPADLIKWIKGSSSKWINDKLNSEEKFAWQGGYAAFSVSQSNVDSVIGYIANQEEHHKKGKYRDFKDELRGLLELHNIEYNEDYLWT